MITIEINGTTIEAETLKEAQRLARKEEKRQALELQARSERQSIASDRAYMHLGRLFAAETQGTLKNAVYFRAFLPYKNQLSGAESREKLPLFYKSEHCVVELDSYSKIETVGYGMQDEPRCMKLYDTAAQKTAWYAIGLCEDQWAFIDIPELLSSALERGWQEELFRCSSIGNAA